MHGYNNTLAEMKFVYQILQTKVADVVVAAPQGQNRSEKEPQRKSWYKIAGFDSDRRRFQDETPVEEIARIYQQAAAVLAQTAESLNAYIDRVQKKYGIDDAHTYLAGFSQGAMLALWTSLTRQRPIAGCFVLSGLAAAHQALDGKIKARPPVFLLHGQNDHQVLFKCMAYTAQWLKQEQIKVKTKAFAKLAHTISDAEVDYMAQIIAAG